MLIFLSDTKVFLILLQQWEYMFLFSISIINRYSCRKLFTVYIRIPPILIFRHWLHLLTHHHLSLL